MVTYISFLTACSALLTSFLPPNAPGPAQLPSPMTMNFAIDIRHVGTLRLKGVVRVPVALPPEYSKHAVLSEATGTGTHYSEDDSWMCIIRVSYLAASLFSPHYYAWCLSPDLIGISYLSTLPACLFGSKELYRVVGMYYLFRNVNNTFIMLVGVRCQYVIIWHHDIIHDYI
jgi:hypothetical protein